MRAAQDEVCGARVALAKPRPETVERAAVRLERAVARVREVQRALETQPAPGAEELRPELEKLQHEISFVRALLDHATVFFQGWGRVLFTLSLGYTTSGEPAAPQSPARLSIEG